MLGKKVFALKAAALSTVQTGKSLKLIGRRFSGYVLSTRERGGSSKLRLYEQGELSLATIHKVLNEAAVKPLVRPRRPAHPKRYSRPVPEDRVQMDTMKIVPGVYQYTAIDDCSRFRVPALYPRRNACNTQLFLDRVIEEMPFPIRRIQTDRGGECFAESVQRRLMSECVKF